MKQKTTKNNFDPERLRWFFIGYMLVLYTLDLISTYLALQGGGYENNPVLRYFISMGNAGWMIAFCFFVFLIFTFLIMAEGVSYYLSKTYNKEIVFIATYTAIISMFSVIQISNIIGNLFIYLL